MDGEQRFRAQKSGVGGEAAAQQRRDQASLPVVAMEDVGPEEDARHRQRRPGKHGEANVVVGVIHPRLAIESLAVEQRRTIHQVKGEFGGRLVDGDLIARQSQVDGDPVIHAPRAFEVDGAVAWHHHGDFIPSFA